MSLHKRISVCLCSYNGEKYISEQIRSILRQLTADDELIISDDGSDDGTARIINEFEKNDERVRVVPGPGKGIIANINSVLRLAGGKFIFLADQDDLWEDGKVEKVLGEFLRSDASLVVHDAVLVDSENKKVLAPSFFALKNCHQGFWKNIVKNSYIGCCMAFRREFLKDILPIPANIKMHDQWIGLVLEKKHGEYKKPVFMKDKLVRYRRHDGNQTGLSHDPVLKMVRYRIRLIKNLAKRKLI